MTCEATLDRDGKTLRCSLEAEPHHLHHYDISHEEAWKSGVVLVPPRNRTRRAYVAPTAVAAVLAVIAGMSVYHLLRTRRNAR